MSIKETTVQRSRMPSYELLRIISMLLIVASHSISHSGVLDNVTQGSFNYVVIWLIRGLCRVSVPSFVMVSGYFMCDKSIRLRKIILLWKTVFFYSVGIYLFLCVINVETFQKSMLLTFLLPFSAERYWFVTSYILLLLFSPILNSAISAMSQKRHLSSIIVLTLVFSLMANLTAWNGDFSQVRSGYNASWFSLLYLIAAYLKKYPLKKVCRWKCLAGYFGCSLLTSGITMILLSFDQWIPDVLHAPTAFYEMNSIFVLGASICFFIYFSTLKIESQWLTKWILNLSKLVFGVYLVHEHPSLRPVLWNKVFVPAHYSSSGILFGYLFLCVILVFSFGCIVEWARAILERKLRINQYITRISDYAERKLGEKLQRLLARGNSS